MAEDQVRTCWERSRSTWPNVDWPLEAYRKHLDDHLPPHPEDVYVAGAAGHRQPEAWSSIDQAYRTMVINRLQRSARADFEAEDLWSEALTRMMRDDPERGVTAEGMPLMHLARYRGLTRLPWHFLAAARTIAIDRHRRRSRGPTEISEAAIPIASSQEDPSRTSDDQESAMRLREVVVQAFCALRASHQFLLAAIYRDGMPKADAGRLLDLSPWQTSRELRKAEEHLRLRVQQDLPGEWSRHSREAWDQSWQRCWQMLTADLHDPDSLSEDIA